jgi:predicted Rossmann fold nucleotide-binding protein DprA/Smf involved in DNA uptake
MILSQDSLAILLLCSQVGVDDDSAKPLTLREWNSLSRRLEAASLRPSDLLIVSSSASRLEISPDERRRILLLASRDLQGELHHLESHGIYPITRADSNYPERYRQRLKDSAPPVLFYAGEKTLLGQPGIAVVGSRHLDEAGQECAKFVGNACGLSGQVLYSGGAKGVDTLSMNSALEARGTAVSVLADSLEKVVCSRQDALRRGDLCLVTPYSPNAGFSVGAAMGRNRLIYTLADYAIIVASDAETGGTWAGAIEALKNSWVPVFILEHAQMPEGNRLLLQKGALPFPHPFLEIPIKLEAWLKDKASKLVTRPEQPNLF